MPDSRFLLLVAVAVIVAACQGPREAPVVGLVSGAYTGAPARAEVITRSAKDGGVKLSTDIGKGKQAVTLSAVEVVRLGQAIERELAAWQTFWRLDPFERTIVMGMTSDTDWTPYTVEIIRRPQMSVPVFRLTIGRADSGGSLMLDEENARRWVGRLREAAGYSNPVPTQPGPPGIGAPTPAEPGI